MGVCEGGGFSERSPSLALPPEERLAFGRVDSAGLVPPASLARFLASWLRSRRLTEPPRPCKVGARLRTRRDYPRSYALRTTAPSVERAKREFRLCGGEAVDGARLAAFRSPPPPLRALLMDWYRGKTLAGRGGSVSRRDLSQAYRRRTALAGSAGWEGKTNSNPATLREGVRGRRFS